MKRMLFLLFLFSVLIVSNAYGEVFASWNSISIETDELGKNLRISIDSKNNMISEIKAVIDGKNISVPSDQLKNTRKPQLNSTAVGYWNPSKLDFYIGIKCGLLSSSPGHPLPNIVFFVFQNGIFSHKETYTAVKYPYNSLEFYRLSRK